MKLIVGLGNPGRRYARTRHNVGFDVLAEFARRYGDGTKRTRFQGETVDARVDREKVLLLCPFTYMNRSGSSVRAARDFYQIEDQDLLVVCDDFNLPVARLRFRARGSSGGQKGLADIVRCLGSQELARLRVGIGPPPSGWDVADYVLSRFGKGEISLVEDAVLRAADALADWTRDGVEYCMNRYNAN